MTPIRFLLAACLLGAALGAPASAQEPGEADAEPAAPRWETRASLYGYFVPQDRDFALPIVAADRAALHLEGRYNYEGLHTGSLFIGWNGETGKTLHLSITAMVGGVFGDTDGVAPGYELTLTWKRFELYSEGEYVIDVNRSTENFFYNWAQLGYSPLEWLTVGLVSQRTRTYHTGLDVQRGLFLGLTHKNVTLNAFVFNMGWETPMVVGALTVTF